MIFLNFNKIYIKAIKSKKGKRKKREFVFSFKIDGIHKGIKTFEIFLSGKCTEQRQRRRYSNACVCEMS